jgi:hypothetical protein
MKRALRALIPKVVRNYFRDIQSRLFCLEVSVDALIERPKFDLAIHRAFNGQNLRQKLFLDLVAAIRFDAVVETGTYIGETTGYMAKVSGLPIYSCESEPRFHAVSKMRLADVPGVYLRLGDSRSFLKDLAKGELAHRKVLFYLDAHWGDDLPLPHEVDIIASSWSDFVVVIDDFAVPGDKGYGYDSYGGGRTLDIELIREEIKRYGLVSYHPSRSSRQETGAKRGCVVLTLPTTLGQRLSSFDSLTPYQIR